MVLDLKNVIDVLTLAIVAVSALAALRQLSLNRASNQLKAVLTLVEDFRSPDLQAAFLDLHGPLDKRLATPEYRAELEETGFIDARKHSEVTICNWFDSVGVTVKYHMVSEDALMDMFGRLITYSWDQLSPAIAVMRRMRGPSQYHNFEYLAARARIWTARNPNGIFPKGYVRAPLVDSWAEPDRHPAAS